MRQRLGKHLHIMRQMSRKGECVLVIEGKSREELRQEEVAKWEEMSIEEHMDFYLDQGVDKKEAMKKVAKDRGIGKRDVYQMLISQDSST